MLVSLNATWVSIGRDDNARPVTTLTSTVDQAALQSLLRRLYSLGIPLISVICSEDDCPESQRLRSKFVRQADHQLSIIYARPNSLPTVDRFRSGQMFRLGAQVPNGGDPLRQVEQQLIKPLKGTVNADNMHVYIGQTRHKETMGDLKNICRQRHDLKQNGLPKANRESKQSLPCYN